MSSRHSNQAPHSSVSCIHWQLFVKPGTNIMPLDNFTSWYFLCLCGLQYLHRQSANLWAGSNNTVTEPRFRSFVYKTWYILLQHIFKVGIDTMATTTFIVQGGKWGIIVRSLLKFSARRTSDLEHGFVWYWNLDASGSKTWKVLKCGAGEGWKRSVGPIMWEMKTCYFESMSRGISYMK